MIDRLDIWMLSLNSAIILFAKVAKEMKNLSSLHIFSLKRIYPIYYYSLFLFCIALHSGGRVFLRLRE